MLQLALPQAKAGSVEIGGYGYWTDADGQVEFRLTFPEKGKTKAKTKTERLPVGELFLYLAKGGFTKESEEL